MIFSANLSMLFTEHRFLDRFAAAAAAGFTHVEFQFPYAHGADEIAAVLTRHALKLVMFNLPSGDWDKGERGIAGLAHRSQDFRDSVEKAITYAKTLRCDRLNCLGGLEPVDETVLIENLRFAASRLAAENIKLMIEPINPIDMPGFFLTTPAQAVALMDEVDHPNLYLQYDLYHAHRMGCDIASELKSMAPCIAHLQIADFPGRHEPGTGEIDFAKHFHVIAEFLPHLPVGCEYRPKNETVAGLNWRARLAGT